MVTPMFQGILHAKNVDGIFESGVEQVEKLFDEVDSVMEFTCPGDSFSAGGGCEAAVTAKTRCGWNKFRDTVYGRRFPLKLKGAVDKSYVIPGILYGSEA